MGDVLQLVNAFFKPVKRVEQTHARLLGRNGPEQMRFAGLERRPRQARAERAARCQTGRDFRQAAYGAPLVSHERCGQQSDHGEGYRDDQHQAIGASHRIQIPRALYCQCSFEILQAAGDGLGVASRHGAGFLAVFLDRELKRAQLFLELQIRAQQFD